MIIESFLSFHRQRMLTEMPHLQVDSDEDKDTSYFDLELEQGSEVVKEKDPDKYVSWEALEKKLKHLWTTGVWKNKMGVEVNYGERNVDLFSAFIGQHPDEGVNKNNSFMVGTLKNLLDKIYSKNFDDFKKVITDITNE